MEGIKINGKSEKIGPEAMGNAFKLLRMGRVGWIDRINGVGTGKQEPGAGKQRPKMAATGIEPATSERAGPSYARFIICLKALIVKYLEF